MPPAPALPAKQGRIWGLALIPQTPVEKLLATLGLISLVVIASLSWSLLRNDPKLTRMRYAGRAVNASLDRDTKLRAVEIASLPELARAAQTASLPLCHDQARAVYFAIDRDVIYMWKEPLARRRPPMMFDGTT